MIQVKNQLDIEKNTPDHDRGRFTHFLFGVPGKSHTWPRCLCRSTKFASAEMGEPTTQTRGLFALSPVSIQSPCGGYGRNES